ncbi:MAG: hypothetical protein H6618_03765 [Deltaproteobacteria bacterium]|nr:hypothetical protein [Deltaproteobacteria bacterium]
MAMKRMLASCLLALLPLAGCTDSGSIRLMGESSAPVNPKEEIEYKQALIRCHKTGGSRVVKINGILRCF